MTEDRDRASLEFTALKAHQWLDSWEQVDFDPSEKRKRPKPHFYIFSLQAAKLKALTGINRRTTEGGLLRSKDPNIQRRHEPGRSEEISRFVKYGYPWSTLSKTKRESPAFNDLSKPGWLPTAIIVNILEKGDERASGALESKDVITVEDNDSSTATIRMPEGFSGADWRPSGQHPIEVIDGQHRLWAFSEESEEEDFELPVVAYHGLDLSWQAYLFWTVNIKPKRINASLAYDLYPLLRAEEWLERAEDLPVYRETRAQEMTEALWSYPDSPWYQRINMLGDTGLREARVTQAAWIRALTATFIRSWETRGPNTIGGLFGAPIGDTNSVLPWSRAQQAAFLITAGQKLKEAIEATDLDWAEQLRDETRQQADEESQEQLLEEEVAEDEDEPAFYSGHSLLSSDQGVRAFLYVINHLCYVQANDLKLEEWITDEGPDTTEHQKISEAITSLTEQGVYKLLEEIADSLAQYDWRTSAGPGLDEDQRIFKSAFRGAGGYKQLRQHIFRSMADGSIAEQGSAISQAAEDVLSRER